MRIKKSFSFGTAIVLGIVGAQIVAGAVAASTGADENPKLITEPEVQKAWEDAVAASPLELPVGMTFPVEAPWLLRATPSKSENFFEKALIDAALRQVWRCSWLKADLEDIYQPNQRSADSLTAEFESMLDPAVLEDFRRYQEALRTTATEQGTSAASLEYQFDCVELTGEVGK